MAYFLRRKFLAAILWSSENGKTNGQGPAGDEPKAETSMDPQSCISLSLFDFLFDYVTLDINRISKKLKKNLENCAFIN
jgi:hypothetical protein